MKILKGSIPQLASEGYLTLQIPAFDIWIGESPVASSYEDVPDEWVTILRSNNQFCIGKETGFLFLTRKGWEANKEAIKEAFEKSKMKRGTWQEFEKHAEDHFADVLSSNTKRLKYLESRVAELKEKMVEIL